MATNQTVISDTPSEEVRLLREQLNRLTAFVESLQEAATVDGNTFQTAVAALTAQADFITIVPSPNVPTPPRFPTV